VTRRLLISYLSVTVLVLLLLELPLAIFFQQRQTDRLTADVERDATVLASIYEDVLEAGTEADPAPATDYTRDTGARVVVVDARGISIIDTAASGARDFSTRPEFAVALTGARSVGTRHSDTLDADLLYVAVPVASGGTVHGALRLTLDKHEVTEQVHRFWLGLGAVSIVVLRRLQATAARFSDGDLTQTEPDPSSPPELVALEETMNVMARRLDRLIGQQREFVADASHQLRTPLTGLRLRLENLQSDTDDPARSAELERAIDETGRLAALVSDLLHLAQAEKAQQPVASNLTQLTADRVDTWSAMAEQADVSVRLHAPDQSRWVLAVPGGIEQILDNLIDNAMTASPPGSTIVIAITDGPTSTDLSISDNGSGLDPSQKAQALDRFWRANPATPGTGLGLSIVKSLVDASRATIDLRENVPHGLTVAIAFVTAARRDEHTQARLEASGAEQRLG
jgi:signal transduction histidine kinase